MRRALAAVVAVAMLGTLGACSSRAGADEILLYYKAGAGDDKVFKECIEPGKAGSYPVDDEIFSLPTNLRNWNVRPEGGDTNVPIKSGSKPVDGPGPEVVVWPTVDFYLNTDCSQGKDSPIVKFWEKTGRRPWLDGKGISADGEDGFNVEAWKAMLYGTLVPSMETAIRAQTRLYTADELDANIGSVWQNMEKQLGSMFLQILREKVGGEYFCGATYERGREVEWSEWEPDGTDDKGLPKVKEVKKRGTCPPVKITITDVNFADENISRARAEVFAAKAKAEAKLIEARAELEKSKILGEAAANEAYLRLKQIEANLAAAEKCAANPNCTLIIGGADVNVNTGK